MCRQEMDVPAGDGDANRTSQFGGWMCRQERDVPTRHESLQFTYELQAGCADRRGVCRREMKAFMNGRLDVLTGDVYAGRRAL